jgi:hypothetical protein
MVEEGILGGMVRNTSVFIRFYRKFFSVQSNPLLLLSFALCSNLHECYSLLIDNFLF